MRKNKYWLGAGTINLLTAIVHLVAGQTDLVDPLLNSGLSQQLKTEWVSVWHIVTVTLFVTAMYLILGGFKPSRQGSTQLALLIGVLYVLFSLVFIVCGLAMNTFAPQWILLLPIGLLAIIGSKS